jgi:hypothetical protein
VLILIASGNFDEMVIDHNLLKNVFYCFFFCSSDINECTRGLADCDSVATCANTAGSFTCTCMAGYSDTGSGKTGQCQGKKLLTLNENIILVCFVIS